VKQEEIFERLSEIFRDVLDNEHLVLQADTTSTDVDGWDSVNHINLIVAIEEAFRIQFSSSELEKMFDVRSLITAIEEKCATSR